MRGTRSLTLAALVVGCGGSTEPLEHPAPDVGVVEVGPRGPVVAPARTMKTVSLFGGTAIANLLIDPTFEEGSPGIGRWYANLGTSLTGGGPTIEQLVLSDSPMGAALAVGAVSDVPEKGSPRTFSLIAQVPGGIGPYIVSIWIATEKPLEGELATLVRVSLAGTTSTSLTGTEIPHESERTLEGRVWHHYRGEVAGPFSLGAYAMIRFRGSKTRWYLQAPEIVPSKLAGGDTTKALIGKRFELEPEERAAIAAYERLPRIQGVPMRASKPAR